jgi:uncharacterized protein YcbK (DUF882 family)
MTGGRWSRRSLLVSSVVSIACIAAATRFARQARAEPAPGPTAAAAIHPWLELTNTHTGEVVQATFRDANGYVAEALKRLQRVLRDHRTNEEHEMDPALYDQLSDLAIAAKREPRYEIISGYRSPATNAMLHAQSAGVSDKSLHMQGRATDVRLKDFSCADLRDLALKAKRGGVGYYERSNFVHIDTGRVRSWVG